MNDRNVDVSTVAGFGYEWERFDQSELSDVERNEIFSSYFDIFPWGELPEKAVGFDVGCGSGRWAQLVAPRVQKLHCIDPSSALEVAKRNLSNHPNCEFYRADANSIPLQNDSLDFGYSLGVLHHIPDSKAALRSCVKKLKRGAPFLVYVYYAFDNRPLWFKFVWKFSEIFRFVLSRLPFRLRFYLCQVVAVLVYFPLANVARFFERWGFNVEYFPLSSYRHRSFYTMRTDALDRFGTRLEKRFSKAEVVDLMEGAGLEKLVFSKSAPYWCVVGWRK